MVHKDICAECNRQLSPIVQPCKKERNWWDRQGGLDSSVYRWLRVYIENAAGQVIKFNGLDYALELSLVKVYDRSKEQDYYLGYFSHFCRGRIFMREGDFTGRFVPKLQTGLELIDKKFRANVITEGL